MPHLQLARIIEAVEHRRIRGRRDATISGLSYDSRSVRPGDLFFAVPGDHDDGHRYVDDAVARGAAAIIHSSDLDHYPPEAACIAVADSRVALARASHLFFGRPSDALKLIGVTGTDGKSTTAYFIYQLLRWFEQGAGFLSTVAMDTGSGLQKNRMRQSTPESPEIHRCLAAMVDAGYRYAVIETTSHGLSRRTARLLGLQFQAGVFTNITHEHLEFHGSFECYLDDKVNLFRALDPAAGFGVVNAGDPNHRHFVAATARPVYRFAVGADNDDSVELSAVVRNATGAYSDCLLRDRGSGAGIAVRVPLPARFNVENALAAVLTVSGLLKVPIAEVAAAIGALQPVVGRMAPVTGNQPFTVIVDYAHSPGSFEKVFPIFRANTRGRLIALFGSAGERDTAKRPLQGAIAARYSDILVLADEDPRGEEPMEILRQIASGALAEKPTLKEGETVHLIPDRESAIRTALELAEADDTVVMLGKGHEGSIIYYDRTIEWDEHRVAEDALRSLGYIVDAREGTPC